MDRASFRPRWGDCAPVSICWKPGSFHLVCVEAVIRREPCGPQCHADWTDYDYVWRAKRHAKGAGGSAWRASESLAKCLSAEGS